MKFISDQLKSNRAFGGAQLVDKTTRLPLQAADFFAYEVCKHIENVVSGRPRPTRRSALDLIDARRCDIKFIQADAIRLARTAIDRKHGWS